MGKLTHDSPGLFHTVIMCGVQCVTASRKEAHRGYIKGLAERLRVGETGLPDTPEPGPVFPPITEADCTTLGRHGLSLHFLQGNPTLGGKCFCFEIQNGS